MLHFRRKPQVESALRAWTSARLERSIAQFADVTLETRRSATLADAAVERALLATAQAARRKG
jgi:DNA polymerase-3 subunit delta